MAEEHQTTFLQSYINMRCLLILAAVACSVLGEAPYPPSGTRPEGPLLVLPGEYPRAPARGDLGQDTARLMETLRRQEGSERGIYHVYLDDGRLQRVQYTAAPINPQAQYSSANYEQRNSADSVYYVKPSEDRLAALQRAQSQQGYYSNDQQVSSGRAQNQRAPARKLASIHFMDVEPIPAPIYTLGPKPLQRIIRQVPLVFQQA